LYINFSVAPEVASDLLQPEPQGETAREILDIAAGYELGVVQLHSAIEDPLMARSFFIIVPDQETAAAIIMRLQALPQVESAYLTPPGEPPGNLPAGAPL
jgi:hypothetical protein